MVVAIAKTLIPTRLFLRPRMGPDVIPNVALKQRMRQRMNHIGNASALAWTAASSLCDMAIFR